MVSNTARRRTYAPYVSPLNPAKTPHGIVYFMSYFSPACPFVFMLVLVHHLISAMRAIVTTPSTPLRFTSTAKAVDTTLVTEEAATDGR